MVKFCLNAANITSVPLKLLSINNLFNNRLGLTGH